MTRREISTSFVIFLMTYGGLLYILLDTYDVVTAWSYFAIAVGGSLLLGSLVNWITLPHEPSEISSPGMVWVHIDETHSDES